MKRSTFDIVKDILLSAKKGKGRTNITLQANLPYGYTIKYVNLLRQNGLLRCYKDKNVIKYKPTTKGRRFLTDYFELKRLLNENTELKIMF